MNAMLELFDIVLSSDILLYLGMLLEGIVSIFLWKKSGKSNVNATTEDIQKLIDYHEKVAKQLRDKIK